MRHDRNSLDVDQAKVPSDFWRGPALARARDALGMVLVRHSAGTTMRGRIVEVEAYGGSDDPASHAYRGKTPRNSVMFYAGGLAYVYFVYGMHHCVNIVTGIENEAGAILIRALEPVANIASRTDGPARLCAALCIDGQLNGVPLDGDALWLEWGSSPLPRHEIVPSPRIGLNPASSAASRPWRFTVRDSRHASRPPRR